MEVGLKKKENNMGFEETELRLGLPGNNNTAASAEAVRKRGFSATETEASSVDLMLNLSSSKEAANSVADPNHSSPKEKTLLLADPAKPPAKAQVVGWPPVRSFRKNMLGTKQKSSSSEESASLIKVSMDGAPYLRKVDLKMYKSYKDLSDALANMFSSFTIEHCGSQGMKDFTNESKLMDVLNSSDYVTTYEDKDGDWMLVGDVPWDNADCPTILGAHRKVLRSLCNHLIKATLYPYNLINDNKYISYFCSSNTGEWSWMFVESCKRLRIMKGKEAIGLAPRAMEKCKNRN